MANEIEVQIVGNKIYSPLRNKWLMLTPEEKVRQCYVCKLVNNYGYSLKQIDEEVKVSNSQRGQGKARADIVVWKTIEDKANDEKAFIVIECKAECVKIQQEDYFQGQNYAVWTGAKFFVTTNEKETKYFKVPEKLPKLLDEVVEIPNAQEAQSEKEIKKLLEKTKTFSRDEFANLLFKCHCIIRNNDKLSPEAAFDEISKILFMKIRYERRQDTGAVFTLKKFQEEEKFYNEKVRPTLTNPEEKKLSYMQREFILTKQEFEDDKLFEPHETIKIKQYSFEKIIEELQKYNLSDTSDDVKGIAFEKFLGTTFRGELGQFFTPRTVVDFMVEVLDPQEGETICDPTCGSGGFLIKSFEYVREKIEQDIQSYKNKIQNEYIGENLEKLPDNEAEKEKIIEKVNNIFAKLNKDIQVPNKRFIEQTKEEKERRISKLSSSCIYGTDANPRMARTSKMNMIMHGDGHGGVHHHDGLINVNGIFEERFDVILTNPPFGARVDKSQILTEADKFTDAEKIKAYEERYGEAYTIQLNEINRIIEHNKKAQLKDRISILDMFDLGKVSGLTEVLFMERCLNLLKKGGRMGIVLPEGVLNNSNLQKVRDYFESKAKILLITSIPSDVFIASGATIKPSLLFFKRFTQEEENQYEDIVAQVKKEIDEKYRIEILEIDKQFGSDKKAHLKALKDIEKKKETEFETTGKDRIKELFDYEIPIVHVEKAGITTTGAKCENELEAVSKEFTSYRQLKGLWTDNKLKVSYKLKDYTLIRVVNGEEQIIDG